MKVLFAPEVEEDLYELIEVLVEKDYYITYQRNSNTTWYIFFSVIEDIYFVKYITNNHVSGQYIL